MLENELRVLRDESSRLTHEKAGLAERVKENHEKIKLNNQLPYLVANIVEVLDVDPEEEEEEDGEPGWREQQGEAAGQRPGRLGSAAVGLACLPAAGSLHAASAARPAPALSQHLQTQHPCLDRACCRRGGVPGRRKEGQVYRAEDVHPPDRLPACGGPGGA